MFSSMLKKIFGTKQDRDIKILVPILNKVNSFEDQFKSLSDEELKNQTPKFKKMLADGATLEDILPEAFATVREASRRVLGMRHFDVQIIGGLILHNGKISEMKTGEGKTLTATLPLYLNGLTGLGAHLVTVNDYLAKRDSHEMGVLYNWLGLTTGCIVNDLSDQDRKVQYACDITYGTNNEFAFDYLRDNMKFDLNDYVQRDHNFCIVDEVDSILIDEARTPLLISGPSEGSTELYEVINRVIPKLTKVTHYTVDEKSRSTVLTDEGVTTVQNMLKIQNLFDPKNIEVLHHLNQSLKAHTLFAKDVDYVLKEGQIIIVDEFTGRLKEGSRWSDGLHQAIEAKEGVRVKSENQTLASITFQNYFRLYNKLSGMTGTADTEAEEFRKIYNLEVVVVPTNLPMIRIDNADLVYASKDAKYMAVATLIKELHAKGQPVLVGTISIESSERLATYLKKFGVPHEILNAKQHEREATIVQNAGMTGAVTIATNMAGRGTDIKLNAETKGVGGLFIIGTERHESRRIDNQLRGRSGRQGDPGESRFFLSLEDDLMRIFGSDKIKGLMMKLGMKEDEPIEHSMISNAIAKAQKKVEQHNFDIRKHLLDFDNVMHEQRKVIYKIRRDILNDEGNMDLINDFMDDLCHLYESQYKPDGKVGIDLWPWTDINNGLRNLFRIDKNFTAMECATQFSGNFYEYIHSNAKKTLEEKFAKYDPKQVSLAIKEILLSHFDHHWKDHLLNMDHLKEGINLRSYGQKDPLVEYKREAFDLYEQMKMTIKKSVLETLYSVELYTQEQIEELQRAHQKELEAQLEQHRRVQEQAAKQQESTTNKKPVTRQTMKVGRNDSCPCGSGKKFKHCHGVGQGE